jgi:hypothetical protein
VEPLSARLGLGRSDRHAGLNAGVQPVRGAQLQPRGQRSTRRVSLRALGKERVRAALLAIIPAHLFFLVYFEELELELRLGPAYLDYKRRVPFLAMEQNSLLSF